MDFEPDFIAEDKYWAFGLFAKKNGEIDFNELKKSLEDLKYYIAAISLKTADGEYFARLCQSCGYKWLFENTEDPRDDASQYFEDFVNGSVFQKFAEQAQTIIQGGFDALANAMATTPEKFKAAGIDTGKIEDILSMADSIMKKTSSAFEKPILKK